MTLQRFLGLLVVLLLFAQSAFAAEVRLLVAIASNIGEPEEPPLLFAELDARRVVDVFTSLGQVESERAYLISGKGAAAVRRNLAEVGGRIRELQLSGNQVVLFIYASSHARSGVLHLVGTHLPVSELEQFAASTGAQLRVLIIDACHSGPGVRDKGGTLGNPYEVSLRKTALTGQVLITSSGPEEPSEEWESLSGSLFTHHWLAGLRGDADVGRDGQVTLGEAYTYAFRRTLFNAARTSQHPSFAFDLSGAGDLVLSEPAQARSALVFPPELEGRYLIASQPRPDVVIEVEKVAGQSLRLAVPPGRYLLRKRMKRVTGLLNVELPYGGESQVNESAMVSRRFEEVAMKGGYVDLKAFALFAGAGVESPFISATNARPSAAITLRHAWGEWWSAASLYLGLASYRAQKLQIHEQSGTLQASAGRRWFVGPIIPFVGPTLEGGLLRQTFWRDEEEVFLSVFGLAPLPHRVAPLLGAGLVLGTEVPLWRDLLAIVSVEPRLRYLPAKDASAFNASLRGRLAVGLRF